MARQKNGAGRRWRGRVLCLVVATMMEGCGGDGDGPQRSFPVEVPKTGQTTVFATGDDGAMQRGAAWPNPRYANPDGGLPVDGEAVLDRLTGLVWTRDAFAPGPAACAPARPMSWREALSYVDCLNANTYLGFSDWHLPNRTELISLFNYGPSDWREWMSTQGFQNIKMNYWSSTAFGDVSSYDIRNMRWVVSMGQTYWHSSVELHDVWPVRGVTAALPRTGQARSDASGDDGSLQIGVAWPEPRFALPRGAFSGVVLDELTGLMWTQDSAASGPDACAPGSRKSWQEALAYVECLNANSYMGYADWVLPNINELESLFNAQEAAFGLFYWLNSQGFRNVQASAYWSSTTNAQALQPFAWVIDMRDGGRLSAEKNQNITHYAWAVRRHR